MHKFNVINKSKLDSPRRREVLPVQEIMKILDIGEGRKVADIGCGTDFKEIDVLNFNEYFYVLRAKKA